MKKGLVLSKKFLEGSKLVLWVLSLAAAFLFLMAWAVSFIEGVSIVNYTHPLMAWLALPALAYVIFDLLRACFR